MNIAPAVIALAVTVLLMSVLRPLAESAGLVDRPGGRKAHVGNVPIIGGIAMFVGILFGFALIGNLDPTFRYLILANALLVAIGVLDDRYDIPPQIRLVAQSCAVIVMVYGGGLVVGSIGDPLAIGTINLGYAALLFTVLVTLAVVNAVNMVDGVDGLAGSMTLIALGGLIVASGIAADTTAIAAVICAAVIGFLAFNYPVKANRQVRAFMGDAGSTMLGLSIVWLTIRATQGDTRAMSPVIGLWLVAVPIFDLFTCFVRRIARGRSPFRPGREHFHHMLYRAGLSVRQILAVLTLMALAYAVFGLIGHALMVPDSVMFLLWVLCGSTQFLVLRKYAALFRHRRRRSGRTQIA